MSKGEPLKENLLDVLQEVAKEKGLDRETLIKLVEEALQTAARKKLRKYEDVEVHVNPRTGQIEMLQIKTVVDEILDPENEISLEEARAMDETAEVGDEMEYVVDEREFNRIAHSSRQLIFKKIRDAEREMVFDTYKERIGDILSGSVIRTEPSGRIAINFNRTEAYLFRQEQIPMERFDAGDHIRVFLMDVNKDPQKPSQLAISRTHPGFLMKLFETEVPEVYDGVVEIVNAAREPGKRAKISVLSNDPDVDPVGACVGLRGNRVQAIVSELRGEKIDIVRYSDDLPTYVNNALAPAEIEKMEIKQDERTINVWVEKEQLSLAIGKMGQNVRLASKLIGFKINVTQLEEKPTLSIEEQISLELEKDRAETARQEAETQAEIEQAKLDQEAAGEIQPTAEQTDLQSTEDDSQAEPASEVTETDELDSETEENTANSAEAPAAPEEEPVKAEITATEEKQEETTKDADTETGETNEANSVEADEVEIEKS